MAKKNKDELTPRQKKFVDFYCGNGADAARQAGYKGDVYALSVTANKLLKIAKVAAAIAAREKKENQPKIATRQERQAFWTAIMKGELPGKENEDDEHGRDFWYCDNAGVYRKKEDVTLAERIKASELLAKSECDFVQKIEMNVNVSLENRMKKAKSRLKNPKSDE